MVFSFLAVLLFFNGLTLYTLLELSLITHSLDMIEPSLFFLLCSLFTDKLINRNNAYTYKSNNVKVLNCNGVLEISNEIVTGPPKYMKSKSYQ